MLPDNPNAMIDKILSDIEIDEDDTRLPFLKQALKDFAIAMVTEAGERSKIRIKAKVTHNKSISSDSVIMEDRSIVYVDKDVFINLINEINKPY